MSGVCRVQKRVLDAQELGGQMACEVLGLKPRSCKELQCAHDWQATSSSSCTCSHFGHISYLCGSYHTVLKMF